MKRTPLFSAMMLFLFLTIGFNASSQDNLKQPKPKREKVQQLKIAYFTEELELTTEEAEKFWPVYREMNKKVNAKKKEAKTAAKSIKENSDTLTEEEFKTKTNEAFDAEIQKAELRKEYHQKIAEIIGYKKAAKLLSLEAQFKRELLKRLTEDETPKPASTNE